MLLQGSRPEKRIIRLVWGILNLYGSARVKPAAITTYSYSAGIYQILFLREVNAVHMLCSHFGYKQEVWQGQVIADVG